MVLGSKLSSFSELCVKYNLKFTISFSINVNTRENLHTCVKLFNGLYEVSKSHWASVGTKVTYQVPSSLNVRGCDVPSSGKRESKASLYVCLLEVSILTRQPIMKL